MSARAVAERMMALFAGRHDAHGTHGEPEVDGQKWTIKKTARTIREPVTLELWVVHLSERRRGEERPLGVIPIRENSLCSWGSIDDDKYERNHQETIARVEALGLPLVPCWSKSGGLHLFLFLKEPAPAKLVQDVLRVFAARLGLAGCEIFPKQTSVDAERRDVGNWMVMPYGPTFGGKLHEQVGLRNTGEELSVEEFLNVAEAAHQDPVEMEARAQAFEGRPRGTARRPAGGNGADPSIPFADGPPCLQYLSVQKVGRGNQNNFLFQAGVYYKKKYEVDDEWKKKLEEANSEYLDPPGTREGLNSLIKSLGKPDKNYNYKCKDEPMCSHCDSILCRSRTYGVGRGAVNPPIVAVSKFDSDPPWWYVTLDGHDKAVRVTTEQFLHYAKFQLACAAQLPPLTVYEGMKQADWLKFIAGLEAVTVEDVPEEAKRTGRFKGYLDDFLTNSEKATRMEELNNGQPWEDEEKKIIYFRLRDFSDFIRERRRMPDLKDDDIAVELKAHGITQRKGSTGRPAPLWKGGPRVWFISSDKVEQAEKLVVPEPEKDKI